MARDDGARMMLSDPMLLSNPAVAQALGLIWHEAELLDRREYAKWLTLWDPAGHYVVPIDPDTEDFVATLNYVFDDHEMRAKRIERMTSGYSASANHAARTIRTVSRFTVASQQDGFIEIRSAQIIVAYKRGVSTLFAADLSHRIALEGEAPRIAQKVIRLIDSTDPLNAVGFIL
jgi:3-phenylpropionate/cinnamic acid dioxygenase small subunit